MLKIKSWPWLIWALLVTFHVRVAPFPNKPYKNNTFNLVILHTNDMHAHFEQTTDTIECKRSDESDQNYYGGFARVSSFVKQQREIAAADGSPILFLNAGDNYVGTPYFTFFKDEIVTEFMNFLKPDAMCLGNHEFTLGLRGLMPFLENANFPVLLTNVENATNHPLWQSKKLRSSIVLNVQGVRIGIIGYLTQDTQKFSNTGGLLLIDEVKAVNDEAEKLKEIGVKLIIALGHSGYDIDRIIAKKCPLVDLIIGAHSHSFLYSGSEPVADPISGPYPTVIEQYSGKKVPIVQAYKYTKYVGKIRLSFNEDGNLIKWSGGPYYLNQSVPEDPEVLQILEKYRSKMNDLRKNVLGVTTEELDTLNCIFKECNVGNLVTDAFIYMRTKQFNGSKIDAPIALLQSGGVREVACVQNISSFDLRTIIPYNNSLVVVNVTGASLLQAFEYSAIKFPNRNKQFLQTAGVRVTFDIAKPPGQRVRSIELLCSDCEVPAYMPLQTNQSYRIIMSSYLHEGGDNFRMFKEFKAEDMNIDMYNATYQYIKDMTIIHPVIEGRSTFYDGDTLCRIVVQSDKTICHRF